MNQPIIKKGYKSDKRKLQRFYKSQKYSASFMGYDHFYLLTIDEEILGAVMISYLSQTNKYGLIHALVVSQNYQHKGYASELIKKIKSEHSDIICFADYKLSKLYTGVGLHIELPKNIPNYLTERYKSYKLKNESLAIFMN